MKRFLFFLFFISFLNTEHVLGVEPCDVFCRGFHAGDLHIDMGGIEDNYNWTAILTLLTIDLSSLKFMSGVVLWEPLNICLASGCILAYYGTIYIKHLIEEPNLPAIFASQIKSIQEVILSSKRLLAEGSYEGYIRYIFERENTLIKKHIDDYQNNLRIAADALKRNSYIHKYGTRPLYTKDTLDDFFSSPNCDKAEWIQLEDDSYLNIFTREKLSKKGSKWIYENLGKKSQAELKKSNEWFPC